MNELPVFDRDRALKRAGNDPAFFKELVETLIQDFSGSCYALEKAVREGNPALAAPPAHTLKSALGNLGASKSSAVASKLEQAAVGGRMEEVVEHIEALKACVSDFLEAVHDYLLTEGKR